MTASLTARIDTAFSDHCIKSNIPSINADRFTLLNIMRNAYQQGPMPATMTKPVTEGAIIKATAHANARATAVECHQWNQHHVQTPGVDGLAQPCYGLGDTKTVGTQNILPAPLAEP